MVTTYSKVFQFNRSIYKLNLCSQAPLTRSETGQRMRPFMLCQLGSSDYRNDIKWRQQHSGKKS